ncbi:MAG: 30S ribosomal protein S12 methylthiotransferase RimO [Gemmatimonadetes bacterium]|nr:30S ribosomal protein S12 methylthiotransferase RimO [Gemmatimonadota bacterium]
MKLGVISLGCDKATVDSEALIARFVGHGAEVTPALEDADVILVNTCGFIDAAKQESIDAMLGAARLKTEGRCRAVVAVGCLVARYQDELKRAIPEVDYWYGFKDLPGLIPRLHADGFLDDPVAMHPGMRFFFGTKPHVRYLKISEGCDHTCAFCAIPLMRGRHRSRPLEELVREAQELESQGAREINLVAQDLGHYGRDVPGGPRLPDLIRTLIAETGVRWYRCLYVYSMGITPELVELWAREPRLVPYIDMPIQHANDRLLQLMRRPERQRTIRTKVAWLREAVPDMTIRTTALVGFPTETDGEFRELLDFVDEMQFDRLGAFAYSPQEGTRAALLEDDIPDALKRERLEQVLELQRAVSAERLGRLAGRETEVLVDEPAALDDPGDLLGRAAFQADDVDGCTYLRTRGDHAPGSFVQARVIETLDYDLIAEPAA